MQQQILDIPDLNHGVLNGLGFTIDYAIHGGRVTGAVQLTYCNNPKGRSNCRIDYRIPRTAKYWTRERNKAALRVAALWFKLLGGFQVITHRIVCHIVARLRERRSEDAMVWAINAYATHVANDRWHQQNPAARKSISTFFVNPDGFQRWLEESPEHAAWQRRQQRAAARARDQAEDEELRRRAAARPPLDQLSDDDFRAECRLCAEDQLRRRQAEATYRQACEKVYWNAWESLPEDMRRRVLAIVARQTEHSIPEKRRHLGDEEFARAVHQRAHRMARERDPKAFPPPDPAMAHATPECHYPRQTITTELHRRANAKAVGNTRDLPLSTFLGLDLYSLWCQAFGIHRNRETE
jgi:hypothetical protein